MKETPILFKTEMVKAILEGRKTQTRRVIKPQTETGLLPCGTGKKYWSEQPDLLSAEYIKFPFGEIGDALWVKETFLVLEPEHCLGGMDSRFVYKANMKDLESEEIRQDYIKSGYPYQWKSSLFMPKEAARIWLEITDIKVERLQDISESDAISEGIDTSKCNGWDHSPVQEFQDLWTKINGEESWNQNPFLWVISFRVLSTTGKPKFKKLESIEA